MLDSKLARPEGFEPPTFGFEVTFLNQTIKKLMNTQLH